MSRAEGPKLVKVVCKKCGKTVEVPKGSIVTCKCGKSQIAKGEGK